MERAYVLCDMFFVNIMLLKSDAASYRDGASDSRISCPDSIELCINMFHVFAERPCVQRTVYIVVLTDYLASSESYDASLYIPNTSPVSSPQPRPMERLSLVDEVDHISHQINSRPLYHVHKTLKLYDFLVTIHVFYLIINRIVILLLLHVQIQILDVPFSYVCLIV